MEQVQARTFHSAALRQLNHFWPRTVGGRPPAVLDSKLSLLTEIARELRVQAGLPELREVERQRRRRDFQPVGHVAGGHAVGSRLRQQAKNLEPVFLGERA